jgi:hypothetical protein
MLMEVKGEIQAIAILEKRTDVSLDKDCLIIRLMDWNQLDEMSQRAAHFLWKRCGWCILD